MDKCKFSNHPISAEHVSITIKKINKNGLQSYDLKFCDLDCLYNWLQSKITCKNNSGCSHSGIECDEKRNCGEYKRNNYARQ